MCGIFFLQRPNLSEERDASLVTKAMIPLQVRGPDGHRTYWSRNFVLGHTRLAIIDPTENASQPFADASGKYLLSYNGEIYNYEELRSDLLARGVRLRTHSDTEVLVELLARDGWGKTAARVRGMFAFVLVEVGTGNALVARDHFGQKPVYWSRSGDTFLVASDPACFRALGIGLEPDALSYGLYCCTRAETGTRGIFHPSRSMFRDINVLPAGHILTSNAAGLSLERYFIPSQLYDGRRVERLRQEDEKTLLDELARLLRQSVKRHLVSDVPLGSLLSGGIDSSLVHWYASEFSDDLTAFVKVSPGIEEIPQRVVPELLRRRPSSAFYHVLREGNYVRELVDFIAATRAPARWGGGPPMNAICADARRNGVKALLGGDCADEVFGGYEHYEQASLKSDWSVVADAFAIDHNGPFALHPGVRDYENAEAALRCRIEKEVDGELNDKDKFIQVMLLHDLSSFIQVCNLPNSDAFSMKSSVELRNPMLDLDLVEFAVNLPPNMKVASHGSGHFGKYLMRQLVEREMGSFMQMRKEGTRNYAMAAAKPEFWNMDRFSVLEVIGKPARELSKRQMVRLLNLEIFHQLYFCGGTPDGLFLKPTLTEAGRSQFGI